jgi:steroid 5-alpha reductase family enzyme
MTKSAALVRICAAYVLAIYLGGATLYLLDFGPLLNALIADLVATVVIFSFSRAYRNSSFYDAYWSVVPPFLALYWLASPADAGVPLRELLVLGLILYWATRLTLNWACHWPGIEHEDWRYGLLKGRAGGRALVTDFMGIHLFPTLQVFAGMLPVYAVYCLGDRPPGWIDLLACLVTGGAITLQMMADFQLHAFLESRRQGQQLATGLWAWSRHPNYFGELGFWFGLLLFGIAAHPQGWYWQATGVVLMTLMFLLASIPMMEKRSLERRPDYQLLIDSVPMLVPRPPKESP